MSENETKRARRTPQELAAAVDEKIQALEESIIAIEEKKQAAIDDFDSKIETVRVKIAGLEEKKAAILAPKPPRKPRKTKKQKIADILKKAQKSGMKPGEIAVALGIELEE